MGTTNGHPAAVTATAVRADHPDRWVRLTLSLRPPGGALGELSHAASFAGGIEPRDDLAATYELENWESGLLSGYYFVCRRARRMPPSPLRVSELTGSLAAEDMTGVAHAAAVAAAHLFGYDPAQVSTPGWTVTAHPAPAAATA